MARVKSRRAGYRILVAGRQQHVLDPHKHQPVVRRQVHRRHPRAVPLPRVRAGVEQRDGDGLVLLLHREVQRGVPRRVRRRLVRACAVQWCVVCVQVCAGGVCAWCVRVVCARGVCAWCVRVVSARGECAWCVRVVCVHGACTVVCVHGVRAWCVCLVCVPGACAWCVCMVRVHGVRAWRVCMVRCLVRVPGVCAWVRVHAGAPRC